MTLKKLSKLKISIGFIVALIINLIINNFLFTILFYITFFIHEIGHIIIIKIKKGQIFKLELNIFGGIITTNLQNNIFVDFGRHLCKYNSMCYL